MIHNIVINGIRVAHTGPITWNDDVNTVTTTVEFSSDERFEPGTLFDLVSEGKLVVRGIILDLKYGENGIFNYVGVDFGFHLTNNDVTIQFINTSVSDAIRQLCTQNGINDFVIPNISTVVSKIYKCETFRAVIMDLLNDSLESTRIPYVVDCSKGILNVRRFVNINQPISEAANNMGIATSDTLNNVEITESIMNMHNRIVLVDNKEESLDKLLFAEDNESIEAMGLFQRMITVENVNFENKGKFLLEKLSNNIQPTRTIVINTLGNDDLIKGNIIALNDETTGLNGNYVILKSKHKVNGEKHTTAMEIRLREF